MPGAIRAITAAEESRDASAEPPKAEDIVLWLPSDLDATSRSSGCVAGLATMESQLCQAQCSDGLEKLCSHLHAKHHLINHRNHNVTGQNQSTRARTLIGRVGDRAQTCAEKYRRARSALISLEGPEKYANIFMRLNPSDIQVDKTVENDAKAMGKMSRAAGGSGPRTKKNTTGKKKATTMSWIWTAAGALDSREGAGVHCCEYFGTSLCKCLIIVYDSGLSRMGEGACTQTKVG